MQQIKKLSLKLFIHYSRDWKSLARRIHMGKRRGCFGIKVFKHDLEVARTNH